MRFKTILAGAALAMALATPVLAQAAGDPVAGNDSAPFTAGAYLLLL